MSAWLYRDDALLALRGKIKKELDPNYISDLQIRNIGKSIISSLSNEDAIRLLKTIEHDKN